MDAFSSYSSIYISDLWVDKDHRGKGYGRKLMTELENHFRGKGFHYINTVSCEFQAPNFYKKCGYKVEFVRKNIVDPDGHKLEIHVGNYQERIAAKKAHLGEWEEVEWFI